jgi:flagellar assembly protein FliH
VEARMQLQADEALTRMDAARADARVEARTEWETELSERVAEERGMVVRACEEFARERVKYFAGVEAEVVKLALAIAARVLHREAQVDSMLLTAAVRVALEKVAEDSAVVLRVPVEDVERWRGVVARESESAVRLVGDEKLGAGECVLDTSVGRVELGVGAQLAEIERGFFDLLQQRPA